MDGAVCKLRSLLAGPVLNKDLVCRFSCRPLWNRLVVSTAVAMPLLACVEWGNPKAHLRRVKEFPFPRSSFARS